MFSSIYVITSIQPRIQIKCEPTCFVSLSVFVCTLKLTHGPVLSQVAGKWVF